MDTYFAPAKKTSEKDFQTQINAVSHSPVVETILEIASGLLLILNQDRQIVAVNHGLVEMLGISDIQSVLGFRFGAIMSCPNADQAPAGCGTTPQCVTCGAAIATMACIDDGVPSEQICAIPRQQTTGQADVSLLVSTRPVTIGGHEWVLFFARDVTREQIWTNLERVFFHDISNILSAVQGNSELLAMEIPGNPRVRHISDAIAKLCDEIRLQKSLSLQKDDRYLVQPSRISLADIRNELHLVVDGHAAMTGRNLAETWPDTDLRIKTDLLLVSKVLGNMVINALEATPEGGTISLTTRVQGDDLVWEVRNPGEIPAEIQERIFQRYFSTKADMGRGLGTYSMKLFGETFLGGSVDFTSSEKDGTCFTLRLPRQRKASSLNRQER